MRLSIGVWLWLRRHRRDGMGGERERKGRIGGRDIRKKKRREYNKRDEGGGEGREQR